MASIQEENPLLRTYFFQNVVMRCVAPPQKSLQGDSLFRILQSQFYFGPASPWSEQRVTLYSQTCISHSLYRLIFTHPLIEGSSVVKTGKMWYLFTGKVSMWIFHTIWFLKLELWATITWCLSQAILVVFHCSKYLLYVWLHDSHISHGNSVSE